MTDGIEAQVERFAPGFRDRIVGRHTMGPGRDASAHDANYIGGDINGGVADLRQFVARPALGPAPVGHARTEACILCSSSTPPGGGVHGMCGWHAARAALRRHRWSQSDRTVLRPRPSRSTAGPKSSLWT